MLVCVTGVGGTTTIGALVGVYSLPKWALVKLSE